MRSSTPYMPITKEQQARANAVDLVELLRSQGETLKRSGSEYLWTRHKGVTVRGNQWYSNYDGRGGWAIDFIRFFHNMSYSEAVDYLLNGEVSRINDMAPGAQTAKPSEPARPAYDPEEAERERQKKRENFTLPAAHCDMRRVYAYLMKIRFIDREVLSHFAHEKLLYESCEQYQNKQGEWTEQHHAVFVGCDEHGVPRHAHKRGTWSDGPGFHANVEGSDPCCMFHHVGVSDTLHVFEAPVDKLSYITLHPKAWQQDSYTALDGVAEHALLWMLERYPHITKVRLHLDNDPAGIEADGRLTDILRERGYTDVTVEKSVHKDWNEDLKSLHGVAPIPAEPHPKLIACATLAPELLAWCEKQNPRSVRWEHIHADQRRLMEWTDGGKLLPERRIEQTAELLRDMAGRAVLRIADERRQMEVPLSPERIIRAMAGSYAPHKDLDHFRSKVGCIHQDCRDIEAQLQVPGMRTRTDRERLIDIYSWLAYDCMRGGICLSAGGQELEHALTLGQAI